MDLHDRWCFWDHPAIQRAQDVQKLHHTRTLIDESRFEDHENEGIDTHETVYLGKKWHAGHYNFETIELAIGVSSPHIACIWCIICQKWNSRSPSVFAALQWEVDPRIWSARSQGREPSAPAAPGWWGHPHPCSRSRPALRLQIRWPRCLTTDFSLFEARWQSINQSINQSIKECKN